MEHKRKGWVVWGAFGLITIVVLTLLIFFVTTNIYIIGGGGGLDKYACVPSDFSGTGSTGGNLDINLPFIEDTIKANISLEQKTARISPLLPDEHAADKLRYELCVSASTGRISKEKYAEFLEKILPRLIETIEQRVAIHRNADFSQSGCTADGKIIDIAIFDDIVTLAKQESIYHAFSSVEQSQNVKVYDMAVSGTVPVNPIPTQINNRVLNTYNISVDNNRQARIRYIWTDSHYGHEAPGIVKLGITSKRYLWKASGKVIVSPGINISLAEKPFNEAVEGNCVRTAPDSFHCKELRSPDAVLFEFHWDLWPNCRSS